MTQPSKPDVAAMLVSLVSAAALFLALFALVSMVLFSWAVTWSLLACAVALGATAAFGKLALRREK